jgi:hypothetical protein
MATSLATAIGLRVIWFAPPDKLRAGPKIVLRQNPKRQQAHPDNRMGLLKTTEQCYLPAGPAGFSVRPSQSKNTRCQRPEFCGFKCRFLENLLADA